MDGWLVKFQDSLDDGQLLRGVKRLLVGVSGGPDSIALLCIFAELRDTARRDEFPRLIAGHVHHGLRGVDADRDEELVQAVASARGIQCAVVRGDAAAEGRRRKLSREAAARALRYNAFRAWAGELDVDTIALAHHLDDQAETVLLRAARGAGVRGLAGIPRERLLGGSTTRSGAKVRIIRPLLGWRRLELLEYLASRNQAFRVDASNEDRSIPRNCIRHDVLPLLERGVHPGAAESLARLGKTARAFSRDLEALGARALEESRIAGPADEVRVSVGSLRRWPPSVVHEALRLAIDAAAPSSGIVLESRASRAISRWLAAGGPREARIDLGRDAGTGGPVEIELRYGHLRIGRAAPPAVRPAEAARAEEAALAVPGSVAWRGWEITAEARVASGEPHRAAGALEEELDLDFLAQHGPLRVRSRRDGDRFWPLGASGPKKLKEFLREERVSPRERDDVPLVASGDTIAWVVGHRIAHPFRVMAETRHVAVLRARKV